MPPPSVENSGFVAGHETQATMGWLGLARSTGSISRVVPGRGGLAPESVPGTTRNFCRLAGSFRPA